MYKKVLLNSIRLFLPRFKMQHISFSQDGEDMLLRAFYEGKKKYKGYYVDVGAHHPYRFSNTAYFYRKGWKGINIEPTPCLIKAFTRLRKRDINLNIGISNINSKITFYEFNEPALNSFDRELSVSRENDKYKIISQKDIEVFTLKEVLDKYLPLGQTIDFFTIDVEGLDINVLQSNDWTKYRPTYILVEGNFCVKDLEKDPIYSLLIDNNYSLVGRTLRTSLYKQNLS